MVYFQTLKKLKKDLKLNDYIKIILLPIFIITTFILSIFGIIPFISFIGVFIASAGGIILIISDWLRKQNQMIIMSFILKYILRKDTANIDELLGFLIADQWASLNLDPINEFFKSIMEICIRQDYEFRRRISEALPALYKLDFEESKKIVDILRRDWDDKIWKSDNRRRTIESFSYILKKDKNFVKKYLDIFDGDEIYTIIAIVEILHLWRVSISDSESEKLFENLITKMQNQNWNLTEINAMKDFWKFLILIHYYPEEGIKKSEQIITTNNVYLQICIARNLRYFCQSYPVKTLELMECFFDKNKNKQVRRAIAKDTSVDCLISLLREKMLETKVKEFFNKLLDDEDETIQKAVFDKIERILNTDKNFGLYILKYVLNPNKENFYPIIAARADIILNRKEL